MNTKNEIKILVCYHKDDYCCNKEPYLPIQVGKENTLLNLKLQGDNTGDNISSKNSNYCELTALYWAWKNMENIKYVGLCHYRRYFYLAHKVFNYGQFIVSSNKNLVERTNFQYLSNILSKYDIVLSNPFYLTTSVKDNYCINHYRKDYEIIKDIIRKDYPDYFDDFIEFMEHNNSYSGLNMFICKKNLMDQYCEWLFDILKKSESKIDISDYDNYQQRIYGFLAERLLNVYCKHNKLKIKHLPVILLMNGKNRKFFYTSIRNILIAITYKLQTLFLK